MAAEVTNTANATDDGNLSEYEYLAESFGAAAADRLILVGVDARASASGAYGSLPTGVTIGGVTATMLVEKNQVDGANSLGEAIWGAAVPTGTSGAVVVTYGGGQLRSTCSVYRVVGAVLTPFDTASDGGALGARATTIDVEAGGIIIGSYCVQPPGAGTGTWTGLTEDYEGTVEFLGTTAASDEFASAETARAISVSWTGTPITSALVAVSLSPAPTGGSALAPAIGSVIDGVVSSILA